MDNYKKVLVWIIIIMMFPKPLKTQNVKNKILIEQKKDAIQGDLVLKNGNRKEVIKNKEVITITTHTQPFTSITSEFKGFSIIPNSQKYYVMTNEGAFHIDNIKSIEYFVTNSNKSFAERFLIYGGIPLILGGGLMKFAGPNANTADGSAAAYLGGYLLIILSPIIGITGALVDRDGDGHPDSRNVSKTQKFNINNRDWALEMKMKKPF